MLLVQRISLFSAFNDRGLGFVEKCGLTWMSVLYDERANKAHIDRGART